MGEGFSVEQMKELMRSVCENRIGELLLETDDTRLRIRGASPERARPAEALEDIGTQTPCLAADIMPSSATEGEADDSAAYIMSPLVGTFYPASGPDKDPFITVGQTVKKGDTAFIIESMKVMNEVPSEADGVVDEILVESGAPVEYGQAIVKLRRA